MKISTRKLINRFVKNYTLLYDSCNCEMTQRTIAFFCDMFYDHLNDEPFLEIYRKFCNSRKDACTSDREIAAFMISYSELVNA